MQQDRCNEAVASASQVPEEKASLGCERQDPDNRSARLNITALRQGKRWRYVPDAERDRRSAQRPAGAASLYNQWRQHASKDELLKQHRPQRDPHQRCQPDTPSRGGAEVVDEISARWDRQEYTECQHE